MEKYYFRNCGTIATCDKYYLCNDGKVRHLTESTNKTVHLFYFKNETETQNAIDKYNKSFDPTFKRIKVRLAELKKDIESIEKLLDKL